jgi:amino acid transporter
VIVVVVVYILICLGCIWHYWTKRRSEFNPLLHLILPAAGAVLFFFPLYYQYYKFPPTYPIKYANWFALGWVAVGVALTFALWARSPERLRDMERVYVEDETVPAATPAVEPA